MLMGRSQAVAARGAVLVLLLLVVGACGKWTRVGRDAPPPDPSTYVSRLFDLTSVYRGMGLLASDGAVPFVASLRYLGGPQADSTLSVFALSLAHAHLTFRRQQGVFEARFDVQVTVRRAGQVVFESEVQDSLRVTDYRETQRSDQRVVHQAMFQLPPGPVEATVVVRDRHSTLVGEAVAQVSVPRFSAPKELAALVPVYRTRGRSSRSVTEFDIRVNARGTVPYGTDTLLVYAEAYGTQPGDVVVVQARMRDRERVEVWRDSVVLDAPDPELAPVVLALRPSLLPIGELELVATIGRSTDTAVTPVLVAFSDNWAIANMDETIDLLRYFGADRALAAIRAADPRDRVDLWRRFWTNTDPDLSTPEHEALELYFARVQEANARFAEPGRPGWRTDRGEVFITIGPPDDVYDSSSDLQDGGYRFIQWLYTADQLLLDFQDESGFGEFRLTTRSRSDYQLVVNRYRREE
jgi:GWxTD domain-containing protein